MTDLDKLLQMASADNISDELLAAYIDGNTTAEENKMIQASMPIEDLDDIKEIAQDSLSFEEQLHFYDGDYGYWELGIPPVINKNTHTPMNERVNYGYEPNYELDTFDSNIWQGLDNTCAIRAQEIILRDYGIIIPKDNLVEYATINGWFDPDPEMGGTPKASMGNLLEACKVEITRTENATIYDIIAELRAGHRVMVSVDADELWVKNESNLFKRLFGEVKNRVDDSIQNALDVEGSNHALVVGGVNVNPNNPSDIKVVLIDSGTGQVCVEYSFKDFQNAWKDGHCLMISTNEPAPYQYNYHTKEMEPSGFYTEFYPSMVELPKEFSNSFILADNYYDAYRDYTPYYDNDNTLLFSDSIMDEGNFESGELTQNAHDHYTHIEAEHNSTSMGDLMDAADYTLGLEASMSESNEDYMESQDSNQEDTDLFTQDNLI